MPREVTLMEMLDAREERVFRQEQLLEQYTLPLVSFSLNIPGPVKNSPVIRRTFREGLSRLEDALREARLPLEHREEKDAVTGCEALLAVRADPLSLKALCIQLEDEDALGRLFDLDVIDPRGLKLDREELGHPPRPCLVCGAPGKGCASRRLHTVEQLQKATWSIMEDHFARRDTRLIAAQAVHALLYEVCVTPKPGLVDRVSNGSHRDMDLFTFLDSTTALLPWFSDAVSLGQRTATQPEEKAFHRLRRAGMEAERSMFAATGGVNTHKGAIFSLGTVCAAAGRLWTPENPWPRTEDILRECSRLCRQAVEEDFTAIRADSGGSTGQKLYRSRGLRGIRGELADGLPAVRHIALPALRAALEAGATLEQAGTAALVRLIACVTDTNLIARGGLEGQKWAAQAASALEGPIPSWDDLDDLDQAFTRRNLSPGGCADLLAIAFFLYFCAREREKAEQI